MPAELYIYDAVVSDDWWAGITAKSVLRFLALNSGEERVTVRINSPGGEVNEGVAIYNALRSAAPKVDVVVDGIAASVASLIAMAGDTISMAPGSMMMLHEAWALAFGDQHAMRKRADVLETHVEAMLDIYATRSGLKRDAVAALLKDETWLSADDAVVHGFADKAIPANAKPVEPIADDGSSVIAWVEHPAFASYRHIPKQCASAFASLRKRGTTGHDKRPAASTERPDIEGPTPAGEVGAQHQQRNTKMELATIIAMLGIAADATEGDVATAIASLRDKEKNAPKLEDYVPRADYDSLKLKVDERAAADKVAAEKRHLARATAAIDRGLKAGVIAPASKEYHAQACATEAGLAAFEAMIGEAPPVVANENLHTREAPGDEPTSLTAEEKAKAKKQNISEATYLASKQDIASRYPGLQG